MQAIASSLRTSVGKKWLVGIGGLAWAGFVFSHMAGNLLLLVSADAYNKYSYAITSNPLLYLAEAALVVFLLMHIGLALQLTAKNRAARDQGYAMGARGVKRTTHIQRTMALGGMVILVFIVLHLMTFKFGPHYMTEVGGVQMRDLYRLVFEKFHEPLYVGWYIFAVTVLGLHLSHGTRAAFQSLGLLSARERALAWVARIFATIVALGFIAQPIGVFLKG